MFLAGNVYKAGGHTWYENGAATMGLSSGALTVTGEITAFGSLSDARLKEQVRAMDSAAALRTVEQLRPVNFTWKNNLVYSARSGVEDQGFIAQEVAQVYPYVTGNVQHVDGNDYNIVRYEKLTPLLVAATQALASKLEETNRKLTRWAWCGCAFLIGAVVAMHL